MGSLFIRSFQSHIFYKIKKISEDKRWQYRCVILAFGHSRKGLMHIARSLEILLLYQKNMKFYQTSGAKSFLSVDLACRLSRGHGQTSLQAVTGTWTLETQTDTY